jgi:hypothetical protein
MKPRYLLALNLIATLAALAVLAPAAPAAKRTYKKMMWGPVVRDGRSQWPIYQDLGVGIYASQLHWDQVAPTRPLDPTDPNDPAYNWPAAIDQATRETPSRHIRVMLLVIYTPDWANGGRAKNFAPDNPDDYAAFLTAAARRYPSVHLWQIWGEPSRQTNWRPLTPETRGQPLNAEQAKAPQAYARLLDKSYAALKAVSPKNDVIGGNTFTSGDISPLNWIRSMKLPNGQSPRFDFYGHNPFSGRKPNLKKTTLRYGMADFSDLDTLAHWLDKYVHPVVARKKPLRIVISEFVLPTDHPNYEFNFWVDRGTQASWVKAALRIVRSYKRIYTFGWFTLYDDQPNSTHNEPRRGLLAADAHKKPAYFSFRKG